MSFDNPTNRGRALKIVDTIAHVEKSAASNKATADEIAEILAPVVNALREIGALPPALTLAPGDMTPPTAPEAPQSAPEPRPEPVRAEVPGGRWAASPNAPASAIIRDAAANAPLSDLAASMAVYGTRIDEALASLKGPRR